MVSGMNTHSGRMSLDCAPAMLKLLHKIWLEITSNPEYAGLHHYHVVALALEELERELGSERREEFLRALRRKMGRSEQ